MEKCSIKKIRLGKLNIGEKFKPVPEEKTRVPYGEFYYFLYFSRYDDWATVAVAEHRDFRAGEDYCRLNTGNYYSIKKEADAMAHKLNAVLKGADVIEMPSEEEIAAYLKERNIHPKSLEENSVKEGINFVKSKIVK